jgi:hypothetical protein
VNYVADEDGFRPTVTYSYGHPVPPVKKVITSPALLGATIVKQPVLHSVPAASYQQVFAPAAPAVVGAYHTFAGSQHKYAASYGTPVFSVKESRQFIKDPIVAQQAAAILAAPKVHIKQQQVVPQGGYAYEVPVPAPKLEYPLPAPAPTPAVVEGGYSYPAPQVKLEYPIEQKVSSFLW